MAADLNTDITAMLEGLDPVLQGRILQALRVAPTSTGEREAMQQRLDQAIAQRQARPQGPRPK